jgi:outer membrane protein assembly factor BamB
LYCIDKNSGQILWERTATRGIPKVMRHIKASHANCTVATDGHYVVAFFGSEGLFCYDLNGNLIWKKDVGYLDSGPDGYDELQWGFASSPIIHDGRVIILCAVRNDSYVASLDVKTGDEVWRTSRPKYPGWSTPTVHVSPARSQVIANGYKHIGGYELSTGQELWKMQGGGDVPVPTPFVAHNLIFIANAHGGKSPVYAIKTSATGDITLKDGETSNEHIAWSNFKVRNYMQTPLVYGDLLYCCRDSGIVTCFEAKTGTNHFSHRFSGDVGYTASPVAGDNKIYFTSEQGDVHVLEAGSTYNRLAQNQMGEICMATPAISAGTIFFRTQRHVVAVRP